MPGWQGRAVFPESRQIGTGSGSFVVSNAGASKTLARKSDAYQRRSDRNYRERRDPLPFTVIVFRLRYRVYFNKEAGGDDEPGRIDFSGQSEVPAN